ncbi:MAG: methyltransferase domain-containing protein [Pirellulales bacterium]|nr:methyltransferase domain-containing protein [Pirellulales bacterium]
MPILNGVAERCRKPEIMDDPSLDRDRHRHALLGIARLNRVSRAVASLWRPISQLPDGHALRILDVATGSGDVPLGLWRRARRAGRTLEICGIDVSPFAVQCARDRAEKAEAAIRFEVLDALNEVLPGGFDVVCCSLFLHQLGRDEVVLLLRKMRDCARQVVLVSDLVRTRRGLLLAHVASRLFTSSDVVRVDGPRSVRAAFTIREFHRLVRKAGLEGAVLSPVWPCRMLLSWRR